MTPQTVGTTPGTTFAGHGGNHPGNHSPDPLPRLPEPPREPLGTTPLARVGTRGGSYKGTTLVPRPQTTLSMTRESTPRERPSPLIRVTWCATCSTPVEVAPATIGTGWATTCSTCAVLPLAPPVSTHPTRPCDVCASPMRTGHGTSHPLCTTRPMEAHT